MKRRPLARESGFFVQPRPPPHPPPTPPQKYTFPQIGPHPISKS